MAQRLEIFHGNKIELRFCWVRKRGVKLNRDPLTTPVVQQAQLGRVCQVVNDILGELKVE